MDSHGWDTRYQEKDLVWSAEPNMFLPPIVEGLDVGNALDLACGEGRNAIWLARQGWSVTGVDFSARSLDHARREARDQGLAIDYVEANYLDFRTEQRFDLITLIFCDLCPLSPAQRHTLLGTFGELLAEGGELLLDVLTLRALAGSEESRQHGLRLMDGFWASGDYWGFQDTFVYDDAQVVLDKYTIVEPQRTRTVYNWLQYFSLRR